MTESGPNPSRDRREEDGVYTYIRVSPENARWLEQQGTGADVQITLRRLLDENSDLARFLLNWGTTSETHRTVLYRLVADESGILLSELQSDVAVSDRTLRKRLSELEEHDVIERGGYPQVVSVADEDTYVVLAEMARLL